VSLSFTPLVTPGKHGYPGVSTIRLPGLVRSLRILPLPGIGRPRAARLEWEFSYRLFPIPQCSLQLDDADSIAWIAHRLAGTGDVNTAVLPFTGPVVRNRRTEARTSSKPGVGATLRYYSYYYLSPVVAVIGSVLAISLLLYQAGWTVNAIRLRVLDPTRRPIGAQWNGAYEAHGASTRVSMTRSIQALRRRDGNSLLSAVASSRRGLESSSVQAGEAVVQEQSTDPTDSGSVLQPLVCTSSLYPYQQGRMLISIRLAIPRFPTSVADPGRYRPLIPHRASAIRAILVPDHTRTRTPRRRRTVRPVWSWRTASSPCLGRWDPFRN
jgi:hypothetical protein